MIVLILVKFPVYLALLFLAFSCIQAANANNPSPQVGCRCKNVALILKIIGCGTIMMAVHYEPPFDWVILSIIPLIIGTALWDLTSSADIHHKLDKWLTQIKLRINELRHRNNSDEESSVKQ